MTPLTVSKVGAGSSEWRSVNYQSPYVSIGIGVTVVGMVTYTVEHTYEDVNSLPPGFTDPTVFSHPTLVDKTANAEGSYLAPITFFRITITAGTGSVFMTYVQAGIAD